jgi:imidazolonepropionase-like amidohydrolase
LAFDCSAHETETREKSAAAHAGKNNAAAAAARDEANASFSKTKADALWQKLVRNKTWVVPTLVAIRSIAQQREAAQSAPSALAYVPPALRKSWSPNEINKQVSPEVAQWYLAQFQNDLKLARSMHEAGVQMMAGSDSLDPLNFPGPSLHDELQLLTEAGFTALQALHAATLKPAEFFNAAGDGGVGDDTAGKSCRSCASGCGSARQYRQYEEDSGHCSRWPISRSQRSRSDAESGARCRRSGGIGRCNK